MTSVAEALKPVRDALIGTARSEADRILSEAAQASAQVRDTACAEARQIIDEARSRGEAEAQALLLGERAAARREARSAVLSAQRQIYDQLRHRVLASLHELRDADDYQRSHAAITTHALMTLGPATVTHDHPSGGVVAQAPGRCLDYSFAALAERAFARVAPELEELWTP